MAQPMFDGHPLEEYLQDSGEVSEFIPGGLAELLLQPYDTDHPSVFKHAETMEKLCSFIFSALEFISSLFSSRTSLRAKAFAERFKYGVISSSLLSSASPVTPTAESRRRGLSPPLPGKFSNAHSRTTSTTESIDSLSLFMPSEPEVPIWPLTLSFTIAVAALSAQFYFFAFLLVSGSLYYIHVHRRDIRTKPDVMTPSLLALQHLISAGQLWDNIINDTFALLENEEQCVFSGPKSPSTPSSSLQLALSTSLLTTQTQCDNVRQLLAAITSPSELSQLAEMYAPPSPIKSTFPRSSDSHRPLSHPGSPRTSPLGDRTRKRSTWNGSYASLALAGTLPAIQLTERRKRRRSDLSALLGTTSPSPARTRSRNALSTPPQLLADVSEEEGMATAESSLADEDEEEHSFGAAALNLYRKRVGGGLRALELSQRSPLSASFTRGNSTKRRTTMSSGSKYTSMHTTRHPFSLSSLRHALQNALASKRFACSHLLALRFEDDEDEVYWEDVRAVMSLLTSTLIDASSRLSETLDDIEEHRLRADDTPDETASGTTTPSSLASPPPTRLPLARAIAQIVSFAPTPSHLARFAGHVSAISSALDDARDHLDRCVASLKDEPTHSSGHSSHPSTSSAGEPAALGACGEDHPAIQAYEGLRRELGLALRECERGRDRLACIVAPPSPATEDEDEDEPLPVVVEAKGDPSAAVTDDAKPPVVLEDADAEDEDAPEPPSDVPSVGIEQVFEGEAAVGAFVRARCGLSRDERIRLARAAREETVPPREAWGPTGDVVQELKDVIWKVGERRRKLTAQSAGVAFETVVSVSRTLDLDGKAMS